MLFTYEQAQQSLENLKEYLQEQGWAVSSTADFKRTSVEWYAYKRLPEGTSHCNCNDKEPTLCLYPWMLVFHTDRVRYSASTEVELVATATPENCLDEYHYQDWVNLRYYNIRPEDIPKKIHKITRALTQAWEAVWSVEHEEI